MSGNPLTYYISGRNALYKTTSGGSPFTSLIDDINPAYSNIIVSIATDLDNSNTNYLYIYYTNFGSGGFNSDASIFKFSIDQGSTWSADQNLPTSTRAQPYVIGIWIAPDHDVFMGGRRICKNPNFNSTLNDSYTFHDDIRACHFLDSYVNYIYAATDAGIYKSTADGINWKRLTGNLAANEFYDIGITEADHDMIVGGTHDCGTYMRDASGNWDFVAGGDGNTSFIDQVNTDFIYYSESRNIYRKDLSGLTTGKLIQEYDKIGRTIGMDPQNSQILYKIEECPDGIRRLRKTTDRGDSWVDKSIINRGMTDMEFCYNDPNSFYIIKYNQWWKTNTEEEYPTIYPPTELYFSDDGGDNLTEVSYSGIGSILDDTPILSANVHPYFPEMIWITLGGFIADKKVYFSDDGGDNWNNVTGAGLPNLPIQCIEYDFINDYH